MKEGEIMRWLLEQRRGEERLYSAGGACYRCHYDHHCAKLFVPAEANASLSGGG